MHSATKASQGNEGSQLLDRPQASVGQVETAIASSPQRNEEVDAVHCPQVLIGSHRDEYRVHLEHVLQSQPYSPERSMEENWNSQSDLWSIRRI